MDLSKAFDSVDHNILLSRLSSVGLRGKPLDWIESYLKVRKQCVQLIDREGQRKSSAYKPIKLGVSQGSILGPILFLLYTNDLLGISKHHISLFADDTSVVIR